MRLAIVGSREISDPKILLDALKKVPSLKLVTEIVSGGAKGVDTLAKMYANANNLALKEFTPEYDLYGRGAPLQRNTQIIEYADVILAIPVKGGSNGTRDSIRKAQSMGKKLYIHEVDAPSQARKGEKVSLTAPKVENPFKVGEKVMHDKYGEGVVKAIDGSILTVSFTLEGEKRILCTFKGIHPVD